MTDCGDGGNAFGTAPGGRESRGLNHGSSYIRSDWEEGGRFEFFESDSGSYGIIEKLIP